MSLLILLLVVMNISTIGFCWLLWNKMEHQTHPMDEVNNRPPSPNTSIAEQLNLNADQNKQFVQLREEHFAARKVIDDKINEIRNQLFDVIKNDNPDTAKMNALVNKIGELETQKQLNITKHFASLRNICSKEQKEKFDVWINDIVKLIGPQGPPPRPEDRPPHRPNGMDNQGPPPRDGDRPRPPNDDRPRRPFPPPEHQGPPPPDGPPNRDNSPPR